MNWGKGITIAIVLFMGFIISFVVRAFNRDSDLISDNYYEEGLNYEKKVESENNYKLLDSTISIRKEEEGIKISFPTEMKIIDQGKITFYRPQSKKYDRSFILELDRNNEQILAYENFREGFYQVSISWESNKKTYLFEQDLNF
ncbi:MAG: FixH family protein [Crocinitomicaceae bacterium]